MAAEENSPARPGPPLTPVINVEQLFKDLLALLSSGHPIMADLQTALHELAAWLEANS